MANCHPHSMCWYLWDLFEGLMWPLGKWTSIDGQLSPPLHPWKQNLPWFASSHLCPPPCLLTLSPDMFASAWLLSSPHSPQDHLICLIPSLPTTFFAHPFPRHVCQCLAPIKSLLTSRSLGLLLPICSCHLICSPSPHRVLLHGWLAGGSIHGWFGCSLNVSCQ